MGKLKFEKYLERYGELTYRNTGISMLPLIRQGKDLFTVVKRGSERPKKYDVILYKREDDYVLHRVVEVREKDYVVLGDNCIRKEIVVDQDILGVMAKVNRGGKMIKVSDPMYRLYSKLWVAMYPIRRIMFDLKGKLKKALRLLKQMEN